MIFFRKAHSNHFPGEICPRGFLLGKHSTFVGFVEINRLFGAHGIPAVLRTFSTLKKDSLQTGSLFKWLPPRPVGEPKADPGDIETTQQRSAIHGLQATPGRFPNRLSFAEGPLCTPFVVRFISAEGQVTHFQLFGIPATSTLGPYPPLPRRGSCDIPITE